MTHPIDPYRSSHLCTLHAAAPPPCPRCAADWQSSSEAHRSSKVVGRIFIAGLFAATVFGAAIGTGIGFAAGASPLWVAGPPLSPPRRQDVPEPRCDPIELAAALSAVAAPPVPSAGQTERPAAVTVGLAGTGDEAHDPTSILARLQAPSTRGWIPIEKRQLTPDTVDRLLAELSRRPVRLAPFERDGRLIGAQVVGIRSGGALERAGARNGDVVLAVNGIGIDDRRRALPWPLPGDARTAVVELERAGERRVLVLRW